MNTKKFENKLSTGSLLISASIALSASSIATASVNPFQLQHAAGQSSQVRLAETMKSEDKSCHCDDKDITHCDCSGSKSGEGKCGEGKCGG